LSNAYNFEHSGQSERKVNSDLTYVMLDRNCLIKIVKPLIVVIALDNKNQFLCIV
jgi:hypothetical protein